MQAVAERSSASPRVIVFPAPMGKPKSKPVTPQPELSLPWNPHWYGNLAQWIAPAIALIIGIVSVSLMVHFRNVDSSTKTSDEHTNALISAKLDPAVDNIDKKLEPISRKLDEVASKVDDAEGQLKRLRAKEKSKTGVELAAQRERQILSLADVRKQIQVAEANKEIVPAFQLAAYKEAIRANSASKLDYWETVAAIINYQSSVDQLNHHAPDPAAVSRPCGGITQGTGGNNFFRGFLFEKCMVDLDSTQNALIDGTFKDSVIRYHGGPVMLSNVRFINCRFVLTIPASAPANPQRDYFLMTLLNAPETKTVTISSTHS